METDYESKIREHLETIKWYEEYYKENSLIARICLNGIKFRNETDTRKFQKIAVKILEKISKHEKYDTRKIEKLIASKEHCNEYEGSKSRSEIIELFEDEIHIEKKEQADYIKELNVIIDKIYDDPITEFFNSLSKMNHCQYMIKKEKEEMAKTPRFITEKEQEENISSIISDETPSRKHTAKKVNRSSYSNDNQEITFDDVKDFVKILFSQNKNHEEITSSNLDNDIYKHIEELKAIIKKHVSAKDYYITDSELSIIKKDYKVSCTNDYNYSSGEIDTDETLEMLFHIRISLETIHDLDGNIDEILSGFEKLYLITFLEATRGYRNDNFSTLAYSLLNTNNYVSLYEDMYTKFKTAYKKIDKKDRIRTIESKVINQNGEFPLISPYEFKRKVNNEITEHIKENIGQWIHANNHNRATQYLFNCTKYMTTKEIIGLYYDIKNQSTGWIQKNKTEILLLIFIPLIEDRMPPLDDVENLSKEEKDKIITLRRAAICRELFSEEPPYTYEEAPKTSPNYAEQRIKSFDAISEKKAEYFRKNKLSQALLKMKFKKLIQLSKKESLTDDEIAKVKEMF